MVMNLLYVTMKTATAAIKRAGGRNKDTNREVYSE
jgi:hypothetical protein